MRMRQLEYFIRVCECGSITRAAVSLPVAQPALGMQIKGLEEELGATLLVRSPRGIVPTRAGEIFLEDARHILRRLSESRRKLSEVDASKGAAVTLGMTPSLTTVLTSRLLQTLPKAAPGIRLQIFEEFSHILIERVERGQLDLALAYSVPPDRPLRREPRLHEVLCFVCSPGSAFDETGPLPFHDLEQVHFVMPSERDFVRRLVEDTMRRNALGLHIRYQVESMQAMKDLIARGMACGILPYGTVAGEAAAGLLVTRAIIGPPISRTLYLVHEAGRDPSPEENQVIGIIDGLLKVLCRENPAFRPLEDTC